MLKDTGLIQVSMVYDDFSGGGRWKEGILDKNDLDKFIEMVILPKNEDRVSNYDEIRTGWGHESFYTETEVNVPLTKENYNPLGYFRQGRDILVFSYSVSERFGLQRSNYSATHYTIDAVKLWIPD